MIKNYTFIDDIDTVMERLMGNEELLDKMLVKFTQLYGTPEETLNGFIAAADLLEARRYVHLIKGASANMGIEKVRAAASALEKRFVNNAIEGIGQEIVFFAALIRDIVAEIREKN